MNDVKILSVKKDADSDEIEKCDDENFEDAVDTSSFDEDSPAMGSFINEPTEEAVDTEDMDTEVDEAEEVVDEAGENTGISAESE